MRVNELQAGRTDVERHLGQLSGARTSSRTANATGSSGSSTRACSATPTSSTCWTYYFRGRLISEWDEIFYNDIAPLVFDRLVDGIRLSEFSIDVTAARPLHRRRAAHHREPVGNHEQDPQPAAAAAEPDRRAATDAQALRSYVTFNVESLRLDYSTAHYNGRPVRRRRSGTTSSTTSELDIPESPDEKRNPRREDRYLAAALVEHLNSNLEYYNKVLWSRLDPDRRYMLLDGFALQVYDADGNAGAPRACAASRPSSRTRSSPSPATPWCCPWHRATG